HDNGIKRCRYFGSHSTQMSNPTKTDVVVSETLGNFALEENIIETLNDARRFLKPGGTMIPCGLKQFIAPVIAPRLYEELNVWNKLGNLDFSFAKELCMNNMYVKDVSPDDLLDKGTLWDEVDFTKENTSIRTADMKWTAEKGFTVYGFAVWWESLLVPGVTLTTSPLAPSTHWKQIYFPVIDPLDVKTGQTVTLKLTSDSRYEVKINVGWETTVLDAKGKILKNVKQNMIKGYIS
ncbi:MAG: ribonucleotide-diphosphate reductase subunit beta, partial [Candidatus Peribacteraceae bacterium]|nr:ribonucleotide-diphosphate reductase subunit beta [Candidatus Peribacteraceae bacterium]